MTGEVASGPALGRVSSLDVSIAHEGWPVRHGPMEAGRRAKAGLCCIGPSLAVLKRLSPLLCVNEPKPTSLQSAYLLYPRCQTWAGDKARLGMIF